VSGALDVEVCLGGAAEHQGKHDLHEEVGQKVGLGRDRLGEPRLDLAPSYSWRCSTNILTARSRTSRGRGISLALLHPPEVRSLQDSRADSNPQGVVVHGVPCPPGQDVTQLLVTHDAGASCQVVPIG
jgi:hypothetical protein